MAKVVVTLTGVLLAVIVSTGPSPTAADSATAPPYANHTVGGAAGWFFNATTNTSATNYSSWVATQSFFLGDYLIFNTNTNMTVVQTNNATTYGRCSADEDDGTGTFVYDSGNETLGVPIVISAPLTGEGDNYFFSDAGDDGIQCSHGMRFRIVVQHGRGLPASLNQPPPPPYIDRNPAAAAPPVIPAPSTQQESFYNAGGRMVREVGFWGLFLGALFVL